MENNTNRKIKKSVILMYALLLLTISITSGCMRYLTHDRNKVLLKNVDIDQTIKIAEMELNRGKFGSVLTVWAIRDQYFTKPQAEKITKLYFDHIDKIKDKFDIWHLTWAISNIYKQGNNEVKEVMEKAFSDATVRAKNTSRIANKMANGDKLYMGDAHSGGRAYAKKHVVVIGNKHYIQSVEEYKNKKEKKNN